MGIALSLASRLCAVCIYTPVSLSILTKGLHVTVMRCLLLCLLFEEYLFISIKEISSSVSSCM